VCCRHILSSLSQPEPDIDAVSIHMVLSENTHHLIKDEDLRLMKKSSYFINTSRGPLVDEVALIQILTNGGIAGAALDVFDMEPLPLDHAFRSMKHVTLSPHLGYVCDSSYKVLYPNIETHHR
jgi:phosphoglycerate dehydrogenase-like enzyme